VDLLELTRVGDVMEKDVPTVPAEMKVIELSNLIARGDTIISSRQATLILDRDNKLSGIITRGDILRVLRESLAGTMTVLEAGQTNLIVAYEDESLHDAAARMLKHNIGRLPVVDRQDPRRVIGYLGRASILSAQAKFYEEEEIRGRGPIVPSIFEKGLHSLSAGKILKSDAAKSHSNQNGL
jgi:CBS domain-containing protein